MLIRPKFAPRSDQDVTQLVLDHPFAWVISDGTGPGNASLLPVRPETIRDGRIETLIGHFSRANKQVETLRRAPAARILFLGAHGYASPSWLADRTQAPTWNYQAANFSVEIELLDTPEATERIIRDLVDAMEQDQPNRWSIEEMGARYRMLSQGVVPFRAQVQEISAAFKLGQDERDDVYADMMRGFADVGRDDLVQLMQRFNADRPNSR